MTDKQFRERLEETENPVVIYVWAPWCRPCRVLGPLIDDAGVVQKFCWR